MWETIINYIKDILVANDQIEQVFTYETVDYTGEPFATITPDDNENSFDTTIDNTRTYSFTIRLFKERGGTTAVEDAEKAMRQLVDSVLDDLDKNWKGTGITTPDGYQFLFMHAAPSAWGYIEREVELRVAEIKVKCYLHIDTTIIN